MNNYQNRILQQKQFYYTTETQSTTSIILYKIYARSANTRYIPLMQYRMHKNNTIYKSNDVRRPMIDDRRSVFNNYYLYL